MLTKINATRFACFFFFFFVESSPLPREKEGEGIRGSCSSPLTTNLQQAHNVRRTSKRVWFLECAVIIVYGIGIGLQASRFSQSKQLILKKTIMCDSHTRGALYCRLS